MERLQAPHPLCGGRREVSGLTQTSSADPALAGRMVEAMMVRDCEHAALLPQVFAKSDSPI